MISCSDIEEARSIVDSIYLDGKILNYILDLVIATRPGQTGELSGRQGNVNLNWLEPLVEYGASPRSAIALALGAKAAAFTSGRAYVVPQDVKDIACDVLRHRVVPSYEAEAEDMTSDDIINRLLDELHTP